MKRQSGFTFIEIMIVMVIIGILATLVVPKLLSRPDQARLLKAKQDILTIENALALYELDNGFYPSTEQGLEALIHEPTTEPLPSHWQRGGYLSALPKDPWGNNYSYKQDSQNEQPITVYSLGADGKSGGEGINADIYHGTL